MICDVVQMTYVSYISILYFLLRKYGTVPLEFRGLRGDCYVILFLLFLFAGEIGLCVSLLKNANGINKGWRADSRVQRKQKPELE